MNLSIEQTNMIYTELRIAEENIKNKLNLNVRLSVRMPTMINKDHVKALEVIATSLQMKMEDYTNKSRKHRFAFLRFIGATLLKKYYERITDNEIASIYGLDRSSVLTGRQTAANLLETEEPTFCRLYNIALNAMEEWLRD